jgi:hypothetical protein
MHAAKLEKWHPENSEVGEDFRLLFLPYES